MTPKILAFFIALVSTIMLTIVLYILDSLSLSVFHGLLLVTFFSLLFLVSFICIRQFIYSKIKLIFNVIQGGEVNEVLKKEDVLGEVTKKVSDWADNQNKQLASLKKSEAFQREFLGNVSHELKTPIFSIQGYILTLLEGALYDDNINKSFLQKAYKSVERMIKLIDDLNDIDLISSGAIKLEYKKVKLSKIISDVIVELAIQKMPEKVEIINNITEQVVIFADERKMHQVFINLIENAIKYGKEKEAKVTIDCLDMETKYLVEIKDNGQGIDQLHLSRLFERFYRTDSGRSRAQGGSGLGLSITKNILQAHGQVINVSSKVGVGTVFSLTLQKA